ncbi:cupin domain-containing protein [Paracraurococcus ruber]|uniref:Cupin type-2 domain-containing protein n=1 Tax=Paracraurococcus ruber TaxID=77675 RepID=A0ABS1D5L6_9PROT|nr:cupin domain-containing protein [Paracraurococcus ruber]MBK1662175.1 hypothetical protein [Paracraurococcus ruber]TDG14552.1 cupin domain-containing protein [Paracraurococcus ruber]
MQAAQAGLARDADQAVIHVPAGEGRAFWGPGDRYTFLVTGAGSQGACFIVHCLVPPGGGPPPHIHDREDEFFYLIEGEVSVIIGGRSFAARAGDLVTARRGVPHTYRNTGSGNASMLAIFTPAGMEGWFEEALDPAGDRAGLAPPATPELLQRMLAAGPKYGVRWA